MCTLALYFEVIARYPLIVAANRDEYFNRPSAPPGVLSAEPLVAGGKDLAAGGTWLGVNEYGLLAGILNRRETLDPPSEDDPLSRGMLCLDLLRTRDAAAARALLERADGRRYRGFNLLVADRKQAYAAWNLGAEIRAVELAPGLHVIGNGGIYDPRTEKMERAYALFSAARGNPALESDDGGEMVALFRSILADHRATGAGGAKEAICVHAGDYGTVSSSVICYSPGERRFRTFFAPGPPCERAFSESITVGVR